MSVFESTLVILVALALACRIAGSRFFEGVKDLRAKADGIRCRIASWVFMFVIGVLVFVFRTDIVFRLVGICFSLVAIGGIIWDIYAIMSIIAANSMNK